MNYNRGGRDTSSPAIWTTKISAHFDDNNVAKMSRQICSHIPSTLNAGAKWSGATCHMAMPQCCYLAKGAKWPSHTTNMLRVAVNRSNFSGRKDRGRTFWSNCRDRMECGRILSYLLYGSVALLPSPSSNIEAWPYGTSLRSCIQGTRGSWTYLTTL